MKKEKVKKLTSVEMDRISTNNLHEQYRNKAVECYNLKIELLGKEAEIQRHLKMADMQRFNNERTNYNNFIEEIKNRLGIEDKFGFNPETGDIVD